MPTAAWINLAPGKGEPDWKSLAGEFRACRRTFIPHVPSWQGYQPIVVLSWQRVKYNSNQQPLDRRGVYAFVLCPETILAQNVPPFGFVLYIGETGNSGSETLKSRLGSYRNKRAQRSRARVYAMIEIWSEHLYFYYAEVSVGTNTKKCETSLLDTLLPPCNEKDFSAKVSNARKDALT